jgi:hypothetical protein
VTSTAGPRIPATSCAYLCPPRPTWAAARLIGAPLVNQRQGGRRNGTAAGRTLQAMQRFSDSGVPIMGNPRPYGSAVRARALSDAGVPQRGGTDPVSPHCSICYGADVDLQQPDGPQAL